jgi:TatA/E family protein of Tat protein translocase
LVDYRGHAAFHRGPGEEIGAIMGALSPTHWLIVVAALVLLFGAKRLPDAARSLGRSARILKSAARDQSGTRSR